MMIPPAISPNHFAEASKLGADWQVGLPPIAGVASGPVPYIVAIGGGKGGVGKSLLSANLALVLARLGQRTLVVDLDIGGANLHTYFGLNFPQHSLYDLHTNNNLTLKDLISPTQHPNLMMIPGGREEAWLDDPDIKSFQSALWRLILNARQDFQFDVVVLDLGAGTQRQTLDFFSAAHMGIVTVLPEPTSIENSYVFLKAVLWRYLDHVSQHVKGEMPVAEVKALLNQPMMASGRALSYFEKIKRHENRFPQMAEYLQKTMAARNLGIIVNQIRAFGEQDIGNSMESICSHFYGYHSKFLGFLNHEEAVIKSLKNRKPLVLDFPHSVWTKRLTDIGSKILSLKQQKTTPGA